MQKVSRGEDEKARIYVSTTYAILSIISLILLTVFITVNYFLDWSKILNSPAGMSAELSYLALIVFVLYCLQFVLQLITTVLTADQQPAKAEEVTSYNIAFRYFGLVSLVAAIVMTPFWSACTEAWVKNDIDWIKTSIHKLKVMCCLLSILAVAMLIFSDFIYRIWIGKGIIIPFSFSAMMLLYAITNTWNSIYSLFLNGVGKIRMQFYVGIFDMIIFIPLAIYLGHKWGKSGQCVIGKQVSIANALLSGICQATGSVVSDKGKVSIRFLYSSYKDPGNLWNFII